MKGFCLFIWFLWWLSFSAVVAMKPSEAFVDGSFVKECAAKYGEKSEKECIEDFQRILKKGHDCDQIGKRFCEELHGAICIDPKKIIALHDYYEKKLAETLVSHGVGLNGYDWEYLQVRLIAITVVIDAKKKLNNVRVLCSDNGKELLQVYDNGWH